MVGDFFIGIVSFPGAVGIIGHKGNVPFIQIAVKHLVQKNRPYVDYVMQCLLLLPCMLQVLDMGYRYMDSKIQL